ncbi:MAG: TetR family transcriptional regulator [Archangiaceae bacterium]|nr:TetR family transcriptional regulator [Archangiaceae bacterium]
MKRLVLTLFCLLAPVALGATPLEALRASAGAARAQVSTTRTAQLQGQAELNKLAGRIEELKAQAKGKLLPGSELDGALKRSQELSESLTTTAAALSTQEASLESANLALLSELSSELGRLRAEFDRSEGREVRTRLISQLRGLRAEREKVRATLPAAKVPALEALKPSDDPEDLLEQADLLKDNEDKVRKQLQTLEKRITEAKEERDLDNRVRQFIGDESLFDESDRRLRVTRVETRQPVGAGATPDSSPAPAPPARFAAGESADPAAFSAIDKAAAPQASPATGQQPPTAMGGLAGGSRGNTEDARNNPPQSRAVSGSDARPNVGSKGVAGHEEDDDLEDLEIQRAKLKGLAEELKARAAQLQKKAAQLK